MSFVTGYYSPKILITGGAGFIGLHLALAYRDAGNQVVVLDNLQRGRSELLPAGVSFHNGDISDYLELQEVMMRERPDIVSHHAARVFVRESQRLPEEYARVNLDGTRNVLKAAQEAGVIKFIFASSGGAVYGDPPTMPITEDMPRWPRSPYGETKMRAEDALLADGSGLEIVILRYGNVYGPGQDHSVVTMFAAALRNGVRPVIFGDGSQSRDYVYIKDVVRANLLALQTGVTGIFNIGSAEERSVLEVYRSVAADMKESVEPLHLPDNVFEVRRNRLDIQRALLTLGWGPGVSFEEGVHLTVKGVTGN